MVGGRRRGAESQTPMSGAADALVGWVAALSTAMLFFSPLLGARRQNVSHWHGRWRSGGLEALRSTGPIGTAAPVPTQLADLRLALRQSARVHGSRLTTGPRAASPP